MQKIAVENIVSVHEIAGELGVPKNRVNRWTERNNSNGFPAPVRILHHVRLYNMDEVREWFVHYSRSRPNLGYRGWIE